jgi:uncharacterized protein
MTKTSQNVEPTGGSKDSEPAPAARADGAPKDDEAHSLAAEPEGSRVPDGLPPIVDAHVHVFNDRLFAAVRAWFDAHAWSIRYRPPAEAVAEFLLSRGVAHVVVLHYAHKPGISREMNRFIAGLFADEPRVTPLATVLPGEPDAEAILEEAFGLGLRGVKIHCHVQCVAPDAAEMETVYGACENAGLPLVMHAGREPASGAYKCDPHALCSAERVGRVLASHPRLKLLVPHLGVDELEAYRRLVSSHENLWLDTTMMLAGFFPGFPPSLDGFPAERVLYGTDFPNLPYAWDRELLALTRLGLPDRDLERILSTNALDLFGISLS